MRDRQPEAEASGEMFRKGSNEDRSHPGCLFWTWRQFRLRTVWGQSRPKHRVIDKKKQFYRRWQRQYLRGLRSVRAQFERCRKTGDAEAVHELRVAIRRTRLLALIGRAVIGRRRALEFRAWAQAAADALSPVRDYDVMIEWASGLRDDGVFAAGLRKERQSAWRAARKGLKELPQGQWRELRQLKNRPGKRRKLIARYEKISAATREVIEVDARCFDRLNSAGRHDLRRAVRRFKYLEELKTKPHRLEELGKLQGGLGELQNAQAMKGLLQDGIRLSGRKHALMRQVKRHESQWYPRCRRSIRGVANLR